MWTTFGVLLGIGVAVIAVLIRTLERGSALDTVGEDPMLWLVATAPLGIGVLGYLAGRELDRVNALVDSLRHQVEVRGARYQHASQAFANSNTERSRLLLQLEDGIAYFDADGRLLSERSAAFDQLIPHAADCDTVDQLLERCGAETETVAIARTLLWGGEAAFEATTMMLPESWVTCKDRQALYRGFRYHPVYNGDGALERVMITVRDETALGQALQAHEKALARIDRLSAAATDIEGYAGFVDSVRARLEAVEQARQAPDAPSPKLTSTLNSLKTTMGLFAYEEVASACHQIELAYAIGDRTDDLWTAMRRTWRIQSQDVAKTLGIERGRMISVAPERLVRVRQALGMSDMDRARRAVMLLRCHPLKRVMARYARHVVAKSNAAGKQVRFVIAEGSDEVAYHEVQRMDEALAHLFNNVVTHAASVGSVVHLTVGALRREDGGLRWTVEDDGGGIDGDRLAARAVQAELRTDEWVKGADHQAKLDLVFLRGMSTTSTGDELAGTGVGLSAARSCMRALGGDIRVASAVDAGTRFELWVPGTASMDLRRWSEPASAEPASAEHAPAENTSAELTPAEDPPVEAAPPEPVTEARAAESAT